MLRRAVWRWDVRLPHDHRHPSDRPPGRPGFNGGPMLASSGSRRPKVPPPKTPMYRRSPGGPALVVVLPALGVVGPASRPGAARSARGPRAPAGDVSPPAGVGVRLAAPETRRQIETAPAWQGFVARHGVWTAIWNTATRSPHRAFGPPIR